MQRYLEPQLLRDLACKTVVLTGARQVGKTTLARQLMERFERAQYLNWDVPVEQCPHGNVSPVGRITGWALSAPASRADLRAGVVYPRLIMRV